MPLPREDDGPLGDYDLLRGLSEISAFIDESPERAGYLIKKRLIPAGRLGRMYVASKQRLRQRYQELTAGGCATNANAAAEPVALSAAATSACDGSSAA
jgi:hypothetical protein